MTKSASRLALAAQQFLDTPFKLHGRDPSIGLDCIGLLIASLETIGVQTDGPKGYALRNRSIRPWLKHLPKAGFVEVKSRIEAGDVLIASPGPEQHHVLIADTSATAIHAHAGLRRVVRQPIPNDLRFVGHWRLPN